MAPEITPDDRKGAMVTAIGRKHSWWQAAYMNALERVKTPGELGELADSGRASIEAVTPNLVDVCVCDDHGTESAELTPDEARGLAFELLVLADLAEMSDE